MLKLQPEVDLPSFRPRPREGEAGLAVAATVRGGSYAAEKV